MTRTFVIALLLCGLARPTWAATDSPQTVVTGEPTSIGVAMVGTVMVGAGVGVMLHQEACDRYCASNVPYIIGGTVVVAAGVALVYLGLRPKRILVAPSLGPRHLGAVATIRWGR